MLGPLTAFIFVCTLSQSAGIPELMPVNVVQPGDNVTFKCAASDEFNNFYWYKQSLGKAMQAVAQVYFGKNTVSEEFKDQRFNITIKDGQHVFSIRDIRKDDEAIYYCQMTIQYRQNSFNSTFLVVNDEGNSKNCVHVSPPSASVQPGGSVSLQCSLQSKNKNKVQCPQQHRVHWFRAGSNQTQTGLLYNFTNNSCVYSLSTSVQDLSDTGTYYCAVASCGRVLFGEGTRVDINHGSVQSHDPVTVFVSVLLLCCVVVIIVLCVCLKRATVCERYKCPDPPGRINTEHNETSGRTQSETVAGGAADVNYAALNFSSRKVKHFSKTRREQECVYSSVRADHHN